MSRISTWSPKDPSPRVRLGPAAIDDALEVDVGAAEVAGAGEGVLEASAVVGWSTAVAAARAFMALMDATCQKNKHTQSCVTCR